MHLVIFNHDISCIGGTTTVVTTLANYWAKQGIQITIITFGYKCYSYYPLDKSIRLIATNTVKTSSGLCSQITVNVMRIFRINKILKQLKPNIVLAIGAIPSTILALTKRKNKNYIAIGSEHDEPVLYPLNAITRFIRNCSYKYLNVLVVLTMYSKQWFTKHSKAQNIKCIANPISYPLRTVEPITKPESIIKQDNNILIAAGSLINKKGFDMLITSFSIIANKYQNWQLVIIGEGKERKTLEKQIKRLKLQNKISLIGVVGNIADWYQVADIFVLSSRYEGLPCVLIEAMAYGLPVVSFDCKTGPSDIITHGIDGLLVENGNIKKLAISLDNLMTDTLLRKQLATEATKVRNRFSIDNIISQWNNLFVELQNNL